MEVADGAGPKLGFARHMLRATSPLESNNSGR
jgi:hypothetical protein